MTPLISDLSLLFGMLRAQERKRRAAVFSFQAVGPGRIPAEQGEAENPLRIAQRAIIILRAQERKRRAAAFSFQAVDPGRIPAKQGEAENPLRIAQRAIIIPWLYGNSNFCPT